jgi:hypothetical protein
MKKFNIATLFLIIAFNLNAQDKETKSDEENILDDIVSALNIGNKEKSNNTDENEKQGDNSKREEGKLRSYYRTQSSIGELKESYLDSQISINEKELVNRQLKYQLSIPVEKTMGNNSFFLDEDESADLIPIPNSDLEELSDQSLDFNQGFDIETYSIDQIILKENKEDEEEEVTVVEKIKNEDVNIDDNLEVINLDSKGVDDFVNNKSKNDSGISDDILKDLGMSGDEFSSLLNQYDVDESSVISSPLMGSVGQDIINTPSEIRIAEPIQYVDIRKIDINKIFIFKDKKVANIRMDIYVGDGINGKTNSKSIKSIKEGEVFKYKGYDFKINRISKKEVEIEDLDSERIYKI